MHRAVKAMWIVLPSVVTPSRSPNKQTKGEAGIEHLRHFEKSLISAHQACIYLIQSTAKTVKFRNIFTIQ